MKDEFFWSVFFTVFFRLPIYESIAAIFWQSASYVLKFVIKIVQLFCRMLQTSLEELQNWCLCFDWFLNLCVF